jgi:hypothetical protein
MRGIAVLALLAAAAARAQPVPEAGLPAPVRIVHQEARWTAMGLGNDFDLGNEDLPYLVISGELRNLSDRPVLAVKIRYELVDGAGRLVAHEFSYNHGAEDLRRPDYEAGKVDRSALDLHPIPPGGTDLFRMMFFRSDVHGFKTYRVRLLEVEMAR